MRVLNFRAWDSKFNVMLPGVVVYDNDNIAVPDVTVNECYGDRIDERLEDIDSPGPEWYLITNNIHPMQSLGLKGVNGVELYEGDIIKAGHGEIFYNEKKAKFQVRWHTETFKRIRGSNPNYYSGEDIFGNHEISFEVIGNIYQNPELLS